MKAALRMKKSKSKKDLAEAEKLMEEQYEGNTGFDPEDPPTPRYPEGKPPWESGLQTDHRRLGLVTFSLIFWPLLDHFFKSLQ